MDDLEPFRLAGRALFSLGLIHGTEGNLSAFDGRRLLITRTGAALHDLGQDDVIRGALDDALTDASSDLSVHRALYRDRGPGAVVHAHPAGTVPEGGGGAGEHGVYVFAPSLEEAVREAVLAARAGDRA
ncbi:MAG TPA: class II aldolase/adducin family protein [Actinomycetota bacterium]|nr:class II aldolase/adducin family protein [Actinomycetota bacterium]